MANRGPLRCDACGSRTTDMGWVEDRGIYLCMDGMECQARQDVAQSAERQQVTRTVAPRPDTPTVDELLASVDERLALGEQVGLRELAACYVGRMVQINTSCIHPQNFCVSGVLKAVASDCLVVVFPGGHIFVPLTAVQAMLPV